MRVPESPIGRIIPRRIAPRVAEALDDTRVVLVTGARQAGKSTLAAGFCREHAAEWRNLDRPADRSSAAADPVEFLKAPGLMVIDEIQREPDLLLSLKATVDEDPRPGRFLLTGSARLLGLRSVPDVLPGRMESIELWPLSQGELDAEGSDAFVDLIFDGGADVRHTTSWGRQDYLERLVRGGFPGAVARPARRRERFLDEYLADLVNRDVMQVSEIERAPQMRALIRLLAARSGQLLVPGALGSALSLPQPTTARYVGLLEEVFLIKRIPAWSRNLSARAVAAPKVAFVDSGIAANTLGLDATGLARENAPLGGLLEAFAAMEIARQLTWARTRAELYHYRTRDQVEVDLVLEDRRGRVVAIDVKASATVRSDDFRGIRHLQARCGADFLAGVVLYTGDRTLPFGSGLVAVPLAALWELA